MRKMSVLSLAAVALGLSACQHEGSTALREQQPLVALNVFGAPAPNWDMELNDVTWNSYSGEQFGLDPDGRPRCPLLIPGPNQAYVNTNENSWETMPDGTQHHFYWRQPWIYGGTKTINAKGLHCAYYMTEITSDDGEWVAYSNPGFVAIRLQFDLNIVTFWKFAGVRQMIYVKRRYTYPTDPPPPPGSEPPAGCEYQIFFDPDTCTPGSGGGNSGGGNGGGEPPTQCSRQYVIIEVSSDGGNTWTNWWQGWITVC
jgi:hypothetical protein